MLSAVRDAIIFTGTLSVRKLFNYILIKCSYFVSLLTRHPHHRGMPVSISVEPTTSCNLSCPECPAGRKDFPRPRGEISLEEFQNVIDQLKSHLMYLMLYFQGEPLLNPEFFDMVSYAGQNKVYTATSTNGHYLDDDNAKQLVRSGLDRLIISLDGTDQDTYEQYRRGGDIQRVLSGIRNIVKWKKELRSSRPFLIIQFLVFKHNEHQIKDIKKLTKELGVRLELKTAQVYDHENDTLMIPENSKFSRYKRGGDGKWALKKPIRNRCSRMWDGAVITWDGRVVPCCFDKNAVHQLGKLDHLSFKDIWEGEAYKDFRKQILTDRSKIDICGNCTE
ncbi:MAG: radical SAM protein [Bacteroidetes bacterium]|nr:MAG: radical SAM protein [Bacteroidota bacterium]